MYLLKLSKRITNLQKEELKLRFLNGEDIETLASIFKYSKLTISRNLKKLLGKEAFDLSQKNNKKKFNSKNKDQTAADKKTSLNRNFENNYVNTLTQETFLEIAPLNENFEDFKRKDLSSISIDEAIFLNTVYMIVDKKIDLKIKTLREYPQWQFLSDEELERKTIQIFNDLKIAKKECSKENKVIKIPNTNVFKSVARILTSRGITRIINDDILIAL